MEVGHDKVKPFKCDYCTSRFERVHYKFRHMRIVHEKVKIFGCEHCTSRFGRESNKFRHMRAVHEKLKSFNCSHCDSNYGCKNHLQAHIKAVHEKTKPFHCNLCKSRFGWSSTYRKHMKIVHPYQCQTCCSKFVTKKHFNRHIKEKCSPKNKIVTGMIKTKETVPVKVSPKVYQKSCQFCELKFKKEASLRAHIQECLELKTKTTNRASKEEAENRVEQMCDICFENFSDAKLLKSHFRLIHSSKMAFVCNGCNERFSKENMLIKHKQFCNECYD